MLRLPELELASVFLELLDPSAQSSNNCVGSVGALTSKISHRV